MGALSNYNCNDMCAACTRFGDDYGIYSPIYGGIIFRDPIADCPCIIPYSGRDRLRRTLFRRGGSSVDEDAVVGLENFVAKVGLDWTML